MLFLLIATSTPWYFDQYTVPLPDKFVSASECKSCHSDIYAQWKKSRHANAWSNDLMQAGYIMEPEPFCALCHAPYQEQWAEIQSNDEWYKSQHPTNGSLLTSVQKKPEPLSDEGITCTTCHFRNGAIVSNKPVSFAAHPVVTDSFMGTSEFCKDCHDFPILEVHNGDVHTSTTAMQTTYTEWLAWTEDGGQSSCQDCHMPSGRHTFHGANHRPLLDNSIAITREQQGDVATFTISSVGVGHNLPSGDILRRITLQLYEKGQWAIVHTFGKQFSIEMEDGHPRKRLLENTSIRPNRPAIVAVPSKEDTPWRLVYHYASVDDEYRAMVPYDQLLYVLASGPQ